MTANATSATGRGLHHEIQEVIVQMETLRVPELKAVCRSLGQTIAGRKAELQERIRSYVRNSCTIGYVDPWRPKTVRLLIDKVKLGETLPSYEDVWMTLRTGVYNHPVATGHQPVSTLQQPAATTVSPGYADHPNPAWPSEVAKSQALRSKVPKQPSLYFKPTPFYKMKKMIPETAQKINITNVRGACVAKFKLTKADWALLESDKKYKLYLLCGELTGTPTTAGEPIQFPHPNEIRFNNAQVKDNVRGLKNKPGTAKPADLTPYLRPSPQMNVLEVVYAFTKSEYYIYCYIVEQVTPEELLAEVLARPKIIKAATLSYIKRCLSEEEEDLITTNTVMTLQCPVSYTRMKYPIKSVMCKHLQCYDALWYICSQMQIPTWQCPVCQISISLKDLAICEYVDEILKNSNEDVEQVDISTDGSWKPLTEEKPVQKETNKSTETTVKKEYNDDDEESDLPLSRLLQGDSRSATPNEPVVISLDSDAEDETTDMGEVNGNDNQQQSGSVPSGPVPSSGSYMDSSTSDSGQTLDPKIREANTPTAATKNHGPQENSINYVNRHQEVPNILGKTPLQNSHSDQDTSLREADPASPTPMSSARNSYYPSVSGSFNNNNEQSSRASDSSLPPHNNTPPVLRRPTDSSANSILGLTGQVVVPPTSENSLPPLLHTNGGNSPNESGTNDTDQPSTDAPKLPPLPPASKLYNRSDRDNSSDTRHSFVYIPPYSRGKRPIVSPFIPKKPYMNHLPQKRQLSSNSQHTINGNNIDNGNGANAQKLGVSVSDAPASSTHSDDFIDLTSD